jgi:hypothetical protein
MDNFELEPESLLAIAVMAIAGLIIALNLWPQVT